jgi:Toprim-like
MKTLDLLSILADAGVHQLREGTNEIGGACPRHYERLGHHDIHPSWSINKITGAHHCFSCGYSGTLNGLLHDLTGAASEDLEMVLKEQSFLRQMEEIALQPEQTLEPVIPLLTEWHLSNVHVDVPDRLLNVRNLKREAIDVYGVRWGLDTRQWILPLRSPTGTLLGAQYRQVGNVVTLPEGLAKSTTLFGYCQMERYDEAVLVESPLDAVRLFGLGIPAISSLGAWISAEQIRLMARCFTTIFLALDNDQAGHDGAAIATTALRRYGTAVVPWDYHNMAEAKDVGDVDDDDTLFAAWERTRRWGM